MGLTSDTTDFDTDLLIYINAAFSKLNQNGVGLNTAVEDDTFKWSDFIDPTQTKGNELFNMVPLFVTLSTKILFDPPPPSSVEYHASHIDQLLWRLKIAYESI